MQRVFQLVAMVVVMLLGVTTGSSAESLGRTCRRICQDEIRACVDGGGTRASCRRGLLGRCRTEGVSVCLDAGESARKAVTTSLIAPSVLTATALTPNLVKVLWADDNDQEHGYSVERGMDGAAFVEISQTLTNATTYDDPGRLANTTYFYRVRAFRVRRGRYSFSSYSTIGQVTTPANGVASTTTSTTLAPTTSTSSTTTSSSTSTVAPTTTTTSTVPSPTTSSTSSSTSSTIQPATTTTSSSTTSSTSTSTSSTTKPTTTTTSSSTTSSTSTSTSSSSSTSTSTSTSSTTTTAPNQAPHASAGPDVATQSLLAITFNGSGSFDPDGTITAYAWSFGDGGAGTGVAPTHAYATPGTYLTALTVTDNKGATNTDTASMTIANRPPTANAGGNVSGPPATAIAFNGAGSSDADGSISGYAWSFGDGTTGTGITPTHSYAAAGTYTATLTVTDNNGGQSSDTTIATIAVSTSMQWARGVGSLESDGSYGVGVDGVGNVFMGGSFRGTISLGGVVLTSAGGADWFLSKYSPGGAMLWTKALGGAGEDFLESLAVDGAGDVVATGRFGGTASFGGTTFVANGASDIALAKFSGANGVHQWSKQFGGAIDDNGGAVAVDGSNDVVLTGYFRGIADFGGGALRVPYDTDLDVFVAKFTSAGVHVWSKNFPNTGNDRGYGIAADAQGGVAIVGSFSNGIDFGGGELFSQNAMTDAFVARFSPTGTYLWARQLGAIDGSETAYGVAMNGSNVVACGVAVKAVDFGGGLLAALGGADGWVATYAGTTGAHVWSRRIGGTANDYAYGVGVAADGSAIVAGSFEGSANFGGATLVPGGGSDAFVAKYASTGAAGWAKGLGGATADVGQEIAVGPGGVPVAVGYFYGTGNFDGSTLTSAGVADAFIVKLAP